jgi:aspartyl-tRNA(Asn)/glutamyl-tRNA(Gln) amidotransferase subunit B
MFCNCSNDAEGKEANTLVCPVCLGMPGTLPVTNLKALELTAKIGLAVGSKLADLSWFDRKHYFYPDLPKGYQISQYQNPFCEGGSLEVGGKSVRFNRVHLEEDAGKLVHPVGSDVSYVDLNRAGTPLAEIVTEPDIESPAQAKEFMQELRELLRAIGVSDADMEKGHLRCDANISVTKDGKSSPIHEIKNLNSFKFVEKALAIEEKKLQEDFDNWPEKNTKVTRGFNAEKGITYTLREKEEAKDYRYFPEPDIPPIELRKVIDIEKLKAEIGKLPQVYKDELKKLGFNEEVANLIAKNVEIREIIDSAEQDDKLVIGKLLINNSKAKELSLEQLSQIASFVRKGHPSNWVRDLIQKAVDSGKLPTEIADEMDTDPNQTGENGFGTSELIERIFKENPSEAERYRSGDKALMNFFVGQAMKITKGSVNPKELREELLKKAN